METNMERNIIILVVEIICGHRFDMFKKTSLLST